MSLTKCSRCGSDTSTNDTMYMGTDNLGYKYFVRTGFQTQFNWGREDNPVIWEDKPRADLLCDNCLKEMDFFISEVKQGGAYFFCNECNCDGVVCNGAFATELRSKSNMLLPNNCAVLFETCTYHNKDSE